MKILKNQKGLTLRDSKGFTLIEILVVIGIIAILAVIVLIAINPARQFAQARNTQRVSNVNALLNAVGQRIADNKGIFNGAVQGTSQTCPTVASGSYSIYSASGGGVGTIDLSCLSPTYIPAFPTDPTAVAGDDTGYDLVFNGSRYTVKAPAAELSQTIEVTR